MSEKEESALGLRYGKQALVLRGPAKFHDLAVYKNPHISHNYWQEWAEHVSNSKAAFKQPHS